jgi:hypothetical protein
MAKAKNVQATTGAGITSLGRTINLLVLIRHSRKNCNLKLRRPGDDGNRRSISATDSNMCQIHRIGSRCDKMSDRLAGAVAPWHTFNLTNLLLIKYCGLKGAR